MILRMVFLYFCSSSIIALGILTLTCETSNVLGRFVVININEGKKEDGKDDIK